MGIFVSATYMVLGCEIKIAVCCYSNNMCNNVGFVDRLQYQCGGTFMCNVATIFFSGVYANNIIIMYISAASHVVDCTEFL